MPRDLLPIVAVDVGNTSLDLARFDPGAFRPGTLARPVGRLRFDSRAPDLDRLQDWLPETPIQWLGATVFATASDRLAAWVEQHRVGDTWQLLTYRDFPREIEVVRPDRVGSDRLMAAVAATRLKAVDQAAVIVDAGTAVTVDVVSPAGNFRGGAILPGLRMASRALADYSSQLPLVAPPERPQPLGRSTEEAISAGLHWGLIGSVRELVGAYREQLDASVDLFLTGGDGPRLSEHFPAAAWEPDLVLAGIVACWEESGGPGG